MHGLKTQIEDVRTKWLDELPSILWAYRTTPRTTTQETPFALTYRVEAIIPAEIGIPSNRIQGFITKDNNEQLKLTLDGLEPPRKEAAVRMARYKGQIARYYNAKV